MSPMMEGARTLVETARPVSARAAMKMCVEGAKAARSVKSMKSVVEMWIRGARPWSSERGAMKRGPVDSPSSQTGWGWLEG